jgi:hypothetical protein
VFTREEAHAVITYMKYKAAHDSTGLEKSRIDTALSILSAFTFSTVVSSLKNCHFTRPVYFLHE